jgi:hypothetical protein
MLVDQLVKAFVHASREDVLFHLSVAFMALFFPFLKDPIEGLADKLKHPW